MVKNYTDKELLDRVQSLDSFTGFPVGRWILGVRSTEDQTNKFDDKFYIFEGVDFIDVMTGTTNAGITILRGGFKKYNSKGCAVLKSDMWYHHVWRYGLHRGRMPSLKQLGSQVIVYRDNDLDGKAEELGRPYMGWFGINFHSNTYDFSKENIVIHRDDINSWSAGCMVVNQRVKYLNQMKWFEKALNNGSQKLVSYVLINEF